MRKSSSLGDEQQDGLVPHGLMAFSLWGLIFAQL